MVDSPLGPLVAGHPLATPGARLATFSVGIARAEHVRAILQAKPWVLKPGPKDATALDGVVGWGVKRNTAPARAYATRHGLAYFHLEDGFVRSVGLGVQGSPAYSLVVDDRGIYYDAERPSLLEHWLEHSFTTAPDSTQYAGLIERARQCIELCVGHRVSKYNSTVNSPPDLPASLGRERILLVDHTAGDLSLERGSVVTVVMANMVAHARRQHPNAQLIIKSHPDVIAGKKRSAMADAATAAGGYLIQTPCNPYALLDEVDQVYVATSQLGFEALMANKQVTCFGMPFYAGWGLTRDIAPCSRRTARRSLEQVFCAAYLLYSRYLNPESGAPGTLEQVIAHMVRQRRQGAPAGRTHYCLGFSSWKRDFVRAYVGGPECKVRFVRSPRSLARTPLQRGDQVIAWGQHADEATRAKCEASGAGFARMEDGFLRSPGLGSDLTVPASLVIDRSGIYYDPHRWSDLERILQDGTFDGPLLERAADLRRSILNAGVSKYNVGESPRAETIERHRDRKTILVPGQVQSDASIKLGCIDICSDLALLAEVRKRCPDDYVCYKPHPDVLSGNRKGRDDPAQAREHCDEVVVDAHIHHCLARADEVHTMTSLVGFEALLRNIPTVVYGRPFYAGWGLTEDRHRIARRTRRLTLDMLVAGTLIQYPKYLHPETLEVVTPEGVVQYLARIGRGQLGARRPWLTRQATRFARMVTGAPGVR